MRLLPSFPKNHLVRYCMNNVCNFLFNLGGHTYKHGEIASKSVTEETIFDHIRKKSKNYPVLNVKLPKILDSESLPYTNNHSENPLEPSFSAPEISKHTDHGVLSDTIGVTNMQSFDISMIKGSSMEDNRKQKCQPESSRLAVTGKTRQVDSFLGFKSVFSFL